MVTHDIDTLRATTDRIAVLVDKKIKVGTIEDSGAGSGSVDSRIFLGRARARGAGSLRRRRRAMETKANYVAVGAFVLACVLGLVVALLWLAGAQYSEEYAYYRTYFTGSVTGLGNGTAVRYNGIEVGHVTKLNFDPDDPKSVIVTMQVAAPLPIHEIPWRPSPAKD